MANSFNYSGQMPNKPKICKPPPPPIPRLPDTIALGIFNEFSFPVPFIQVYDVLVIHPDLPLNHPVKLDILFANPEVTKLQDGKNRSTSEPAKIRVQFAGFGIRRNATFKISWPGERDINTQYVFRSILCTET